MPELSPRMVLARAALKLQPDRHLVALMRDGHEAAFEEVVRRYRDPLVAFAGRIVPPHRAEDVVQESLTRAHAAILRDGADLALKPWLYAIVRNRSLNDLRDEPVHEHLGEDHDGVLQPPAIAEHRAELAGLVAGIQALPPSQRDALVKRELEGRGHGEIAAQMDLSPGAVRQLIFRARATLREGAGLLVPAPLLRALLDAAERHDQALGAGVAVAGGGAGLALKVGVATLVGGAALGGGLAIRDGDRGDTTRVAAAASPERERTAARKLGHGPGGGQPAAARGSDGEGQGAGDDDADEQGGDDSGSGDDGAGGDSGRDGAGSGPDGGDDDGSGAGGEPDDPEPVDEPEEPEVDNSGPGSNSGPGAGVDLGAVAESD